MNLMIIIWLGLIEKIQAGTDFKNFMVLKNKRATEAETISVTDSRSLTECAVRCKLTEGCNKANYISSSCELLRDVNGDAIIIDEEESSLLYTVMTCAAVYDLISGIDDAALSASSFTHRPSGSRLTIRGTWAAGSTALPQWIQADLGERRIVIAIRTRGYWTSYTTQFSISTSFDGSTWDTIQAADGEGDLVFRGNFDPTSIVTNTLPSAIVTRFVRLHVVTFNIWPLLKWTINGCPIA